MATPISVCQPAGSTPRSADNHSLLTLKAAASSLAISRRTLERLMASGTFPPPLKIGRASRVDPSDVATYLEKLRRERGDKQGAS
ncbi:helix-turn-helix transcriptional regulator [Oleiharenicola lentus]|uniref:helix-turn-helix transcriptional regulator n=1 Tax=Oleiharenicola lentus TaxID=2508720 RepID=UPI003F670805